MATKNKVVKGGLKKVGVCDFCNTEAKPLKKCASCGRDTRAPCPHRAPRQEPQLSSLEVAYLHSPSAVAAQT